MRITNCPYPAATTTTTPEPVDFPNGTWPLPPDFERLGPNDTRPIPPLDVPESPSLAPEEEAESDQDADWGYLGVLLALGAAYCFFRVWRRWRGTPVRVAPPFPTGMAFAPRPLRPPPVTQAFPPKPRRSSPILGADTYARPPINRRASTPWTDVRVWNLPVAPLLPIPEAIPGQQDVSHCDQSSLDLDLAGVRAEDLLPEPSESKSELVGLPGCSWEDDDVFYSPPASPPAESTPGASHYGEPCFG